MVRKVECWLLMLVLLFASFRLIPTVKATKLLGDLSGEHCDDELVEVMVFLRNVSSEKVMTTFAERYPEESELYTYVKESEESLSLDEAEGLLLQEAISHKRDIYCEYYDTWNGEFLKTYDNQVECLFQSSFSPMLILRTDYSALDEMEKDNRVEWITRFYGAEVVDDGLDDANVFTRANYVRDSCGNRGSGVKIGMIESSVPNTADSYLSSATIHKRYASAATSTHATTVARIMVGTSASDNNDGFAPDAELYCCGSTGNPTDFYDGVEWLLRQYVNVINMSMRISSAYASDGVYDIVSRWVDHIAVNHDVHFVKSAGNSGGMISPPGMAYNIMTVGAFDPVTATAWNQFNLFSLASFSSYDESGTDRAEKPNLVADGMNFWGMDGTSFAAPQVTGTIAQLCSYQPNLKTKQTIVGAVLMASAAHKIDALGNGSVGDIFASSVQLAGTTQISDKEGAGILDSRWARDIVVSGKYWNPIVYDAGFPYNRTVSLSANANTVVRICIFWLRQNSVSEPHNDPNVSVTTASMSNLDLYVYGPNGSEVAKSTTAKGNFEIVQFTPQTSGNYTIQIKDLGGHTGKDYIGIAMWTGTNGQ